MSNTFSTQLTQQRITDAGGREFRFRGDLYSQESTFPLVFIVLRGIRLQEINELWSFFFLVFLIVGNCGSAYCNGS